MKRFLLVLFLVALAAVLAYITTRAGVSPEENKIRQIRLLAQQVGQITADSADALLSLPPWPPQINLNIVESRRVKSIEVGDGGLYLIARTGLQGDLIYDIRDFDRSAK